MKTVKPTRGDPRAKGKPKTMNPEDRDATFDIFQKIVLKRAKLE